MKNNYLYKSELYISGIILLPILTLFGILQFGFLGLSINNPVLSFKNLIITGIIVDYLILAVFFYHFYFYEDRVERIFVFRPFFRRKTFLYKQICKIKYLDVGGRGEHPEFLIYLNGRRFSLFKAFIFRKKTNKIKITEFLMSKNIVMQVYTIFIKSNKEIIDLVKAKYPDNVRTRPWYEYKSIGYI
jgi:hypothetical protein